MPKLKTGFNGEELRRRRRERDLTQGDVAEKLGVSVAVVSAWEQGGKTPNWRRACQLADAVGVTLDQLRG